MKKIFLIALSLFSMIPAHASDGASRAALLSVAAVSVGAGALHALCTSHNRYFDPTLPPLADAPDGRMYATIERYLATVGRSHDPQADRVRSFLRGGERRPGYLAYDMMEVARVMHEWHCRHMHLPEGTVPASLEQMPEARDAWCARSVFLAEVSMRNGPHLQLFSDDVVGVPAFRTGNRAKSVSDHLMTAASGALIAGCAIGSIKLLRSSVASFFVGVGLCCATARFAPCYWALSRLEIFSPFEVLKRSASMSVKPSASRVLAVAFTVDEIASLPVGRGLAALDEGAQTFFFGDEEDELN